MQSEKQRERLTDFSLLFYLYCHIRVLNFSKRKILNFYRFVSSRAFPISLLHHIEKCNSKNQAKEHENANSSITSTSSRYASIIYKTFSILFTLHKNIQR